MRISGSVAPTIPFHLARAYGVRPPAAAAPVAPTTKATPALSPMVAERLVAGVVPGRVNFDAPSGPDRTFELYRHPADRNIAATGVGLGRVIDVSG